MSRLSDVKSPVNGSKWYGEHFDTTGKLSCSFIYSWERFLWMRVSTQVQSVNWTPCIADDADDISESTSEYRITTITALIVLKYSAKVVFDLIL